MFLPLHIINLTIIQYSKYVGKPIDRIYGRAHSKGFGPEGRDKQDA